MTLEQDENLRQLIAGVYAAGVSPLARSTASMWGRVRAQPWRIVVAVPATAGALVLGCAYALIATVVPLCVGFILTLTSPIIAFVAVTGPFGDRGRHDGGRSR